MEILPLWGRACCFTIFADKLLTNSYETFEG